MGADLETTALHFGTRIAFIHVRPEGTPGYFTLGRLFANGYLKALLRGTEKPLY